MLGSSFRTHLPARDPGQAGLHGATAGHALMIGEASYTLAYTAQQRVAQSSDRNIAETLRERYIQPL